VLTHLQARLLEQALGRAPREEAQVTAIHDALVRVVEPARGDLRTHGPVNRIGLAQLLNCAERLICLLSVSGKKAFVAAVSLSVRGEPHVSR
jgi:hypothetical protein